MRAGFARFIGRVFRWLGCEFIKGYMEATSSDAHQPDLAMPEIKQMEKQAVNRPVPELSITAEHLPNSTASKPPSAPPTWASSAPTAARTK